MISFCCDGAWTGKGDAPIPASRISLSEGRIVSIEDAPATGSGIFVIPSFVDAHFHFLWTGLEQLYVDLRLAESSGDFLEIIESKVSEFRTGRILRAFGFDESLWMRRSLPSLDELDRVTGDRPLFARRVCCHKALVNSAMMRMLPADCPGLDPATGIICEGIVLGFENLFQLDDELLMEAGEKAVAKAFSSGITAGATFESLNSVRALGKMSIPMQLAVFLFENDLDRLETVLRDERESLPELAGLKFFLDGSLGAATAAVSGTYLDGSSAEPILTDDQLLRCLDLSKRYNMKTALHAIGAKALHQIGTVSKSFTANDASGNTPLRIEHAEELMEIWPWEWDPSVHQFCMQPNFVEYWQRDGGLYETRLGPDRAKVLNPFGAVLNAGFTLGFGSDGMPLGPLKGLGGATNHTNPDMSLDIHSALRAYTIGAAELCGFSELAKYLAPGRQADLTILSCDPFRVPWSKIEVVAVLKRGELVYGSLDTEEVA